MIVEVSVKHRSSALDEIGWAKYSVERHMLGSVNVKARHAVVNLS